MAGLDVLGKIGKIGKAASAATRAKPVQEIDPLAQAIAARMAGQLEGVKSLSGLESLKGVNLPAAYAGDQRSLQAVQRAINKAETGLESPGRRKVLKQGAAMAARAAVPDVVTDALGANIAKNVMKDVVAGPEIPDESIQAAVAAAMKNLLNSGSLQDQPWVIDDVLNGVLSSPREVADELGVSISAAKTIYNNIKATNPLAIDAKWGFTPGTVGGYIKKNVAPDAHPGSMASDWLHRTPELEGDPNIDYYKLLDKLTPDDVAAMKKAASGATEDERLQAAVNIINDKAYQDYVGQHKKLLGSRYNELCASGKCPSLDRAFDVESETAFEYNDDLWSRISEILGQ